MKLMKGECLGGAGRSKSLSWAVVLLIAMGLGWTRIATAQAVNTTTVQGTLYLANGQPGSGSVRVSWPAFTTANGQAVVADSTTVTVGADGFLSVNLAPNQGAAPAGLYYTAVLYMSDGSVGTQYWVVPAAAQATLAQVQAQVMPAAQAVQAVSKAYVDQSIAQISQSSLTSSGGTLTGPLYLDGDPTQPLQAADKHYVDSAVSQATPISSGSLGQIAYYSGNGTSISGLNAVPLTAGGTGASTAQAALENLGGISSSTTSVQAMAGPLNIPTVTASNAIFASGPYIDIRSYGAKCDGSTDDQVAIQNALNAWKTSGGTVISPSGAVCAIKAPVDVQFTASNTEPVVKTIDLRGSTWSFQIPSGQTALKFEIPTSVSSDVYIQNVKLMNGTIQDSGNAAIVLDFNGGGNTHGFLGDVETDKLKVVSNGSGHAIHLKSVFQSHFYSTTAQNSAGQISGSYDWFIEQENAGDQLTGDIELINCEGLQGDRGIYSTATGEVKVLGGTFLQTKEQGFLATQTTGSSVHNAHFEQTWFNNAPGSSYRPDIECDGPCEIGANVDVSAGTPNGKANYVVRSYVAAAGNTTTIALNPASTGTLQAFAQNDGIAGTTFIGISPSQVTEFAGAMCYIGYGGGSSYCDGTLAAGVVKSGGASVLSQNQSTPQWIQVGNLSNDGYYAVWHNSAWSTVPEIYFATNYGGGSFGIMGLYENSGTVQYETCTTQTSVTPPAFSNPSGCSATFKMSTATGLTLNGTTYIDQNGNISGSTGTFTGLVTGANDTRKTSSTTIATTSFTSTGLALPTVSASTTKTGRCVVFWQMSSTSYTATFGIGMNNAPTGLWGGSTVTYAAAGTSNWLAFSQTATAATAISTAATAGVANTTYNAEIDFTLQTDATNPVQITLYGETSNASGTLSIQPGSACYWLP